MGNYRQFELGDGVEAGLRGFGEAHDVTRGGAAKEFGRRAFPARVHRLADGRKVKFAIIPGTL